MAQALPSGYCGLPAVQQRCPHANACLLCAGLAADIQEFVLKPLTKEMAQATVNKFLAKKISSPLKFT